MVIDFKYGAINQFNTTVFPIWNWSTCPVIEVLVLKLNMTGKRANVDFTGKRSEVVFTGKRSNLTFTKVDC